MSYISVDFEESYRCADVIESLAHQLHELVKGEAYIPGDEDAYCHTLEVYSRKLSALAADLYNANRDYELEDARAYGKSVEEKPRKLFSVDADTHGKLLAEISAKLDQCAEEVPGEISVRNNLYFRMKDSAKEARMLIKEQAD